MDYRNAARQAAAKYGLNPTIFLRQINQESGFNPAARSGAGAIGIAQIVPKYHPGVDPTDPLASLDYAAKWMSSLVKQYGGSYEKSLSVYNSGKPDAYLDPNFANGQTYNYVRSILRGGKSPGSSPGIGAPSPSPQLGKTPPASITLTTPPAPDATKQTDFQALANLYRDQAISGLGDIATGQKATDVFAQTAARKTTVPPVPPAPTGITNMVSSMPVVVHNQKDPVEAQAAKLVQKYLGVRYVWGGATPKGFDCSGLVQYVYHALGVTIPRTTYDQWDAGTPVQGDLKPGDAVFFTGSDPANGKPGHEGLYIGGGKFIEAPHSGDVVKISTLAGRKDYVGARRFA